MTRPAASAYTAVSDPLSTSRLIAAVALCSDRVSGDCVDSPIGHGHTLLSAAFQVVVGGVLVFITEEGIGSSYSLCQAKPITSSVDRGGVSRPVNGAEMLSLNEGLCKFLTLARSESSTLKLAEL